MTNEALKQSLEIVFPTATWEEGGEFLNMLIPSEDLLPVMAALSSNADYQFNYLFCLTCVDWKTHLNMVYHLLSKTHKHALVVKAKITNCEKPQIETVSGLWKTAIFHEREVFDLFGVIFLHHPDMRRLLMDENWEGFPLRKNYVDENMIAL